MKKLLSVVLVLTMLMTLFVPFASAQELDNNIPSTSLKKEVYADGKVWFDLNGNAKFFINTEADDYADRFTMEFLPGVDYSGFVKKPTGDFATDKAAIISLGTGTGRGGAAMPYTTNANPKNPTGSTPADFKTDADGNFWYTFEENTYLIRPEENVLKFAKTVVDTSSLTDKAKIQRYESLDKGTIDVPDAKYSKVGLFIAIRYNYTKAVNVAFHYKGESLPEEKIIDLTTKEDYKEDLYFNNLAQENSDYDFNCMHAFTNLEFEINADKILEKIVVSDPGVDSAGTTRNPDVPIHVISAWGEELSLEEKIAKLETLNTAGVTNTESYEKVVEAIEDIDAYIVNHEASLTEEQKVVYDAAKENLVTGEEIVAQEKAYAQPKKWLEFKGNAKLFMLYNSEKYRNRITATDYLPGLDYGGGAASITGTFDTDKTAVAAFGSKSDEFAMFPYTIDNGKVPLAKADANTITDFTTKNGNLYWNINGKDYLVRPDKEVVKVAMNVLTSNIKDAEKKAKYDTLAGYTIDIPDGRYDKIGLLAGIFNKYNRSPGITLIYENGYEENNTIKVAGQAVENNYRTGSQYFHPMDTKTLSTHINYWHTFSEHEITADPSKKLTAIKITPAGSADYRYPVYVISVWGYEITVAKRIEELATLNETGVTDHASFEVVKEAVDIIDNKLSETGVTSSALKPEDKAIYDAAKANLSAYENALAQEKLYAQHKEWFDLNGNAKLFINTEDEIYTSGEYKTMEFLPGVDYSGYLATATGDFATDKAKITNPGYGGAAFPYTTDNYPTTTGVKVPADFKTGEDGHLWYTFEGNDYLVRPEENVIKLVYSTTNTSKLKDRDVIKRYQSLNTGVTMDVPDGQYEKFGVLLTTRWNYSKVLEFSLYYKGESEPKSIKIDTLSYGTAEDLRFVGLTSDSADCGHSLTRLEFDIAENKDKILEKIHIKDYGIKLTDGTAKNPGWPTHIISAWGDEITLDKKIIVLDELNKVEIVDDAGYKTLRAAVTEVEDVFVRTSTTVKELKAEDKVIYDTAKEKLSAYEGTFKLNNDELVITSELDFEGNSRLFVKTDDEVYINRATYTDYLPGVDFAGFTTHPKNDFATTQAAITLPKEGGAMFAYTVNENPKSVSVNTIPDFSLENGKYYWTIKNVPYRIRPDKNVMKLVSYSCVLPADMEESKKARYRSLRDGILVDVPDGNYETVGFLAGTECNWRKSYDVSLYYEGVEEPVTTTVEINGSMNAPGSGYTDGTLNLRTFLGTTTSESDINFVPQEVTADSSKVLKAVKFADSISANHNPTRNGIIVSIWGKQTIKGALSEINENTSKKQAEIIVDAIDKTLADNDITADDLTDETKAKYNLAKIAASSLEVKSAEFADSKVTVSYETGVDTDAKVIVAEYDDEEETLFNKATIIPVEFNAESKAYEAPFIATGNKVKVFVWKDMVNFFPYK